MRAPSLSVVIPVYNEAPHIRATIASLAEALDRTRFDAQVIVVDDGSSDGTGESARDAADGRLRLLVLTQPNRGRHEARLAGLAAASGELVLLLDGRVRLAPGSLRFVEGRLERGERVWNGHVHVEADNAYGRFWALLAELAWRDYFDDPRTTAFGAEEFDRFPKGAGCFLASRELLVDAFSQFRSRYSDVRMANDDAHALRAIAGRTPIGISPEFACVYSPRTTASRFFRHAIHRGLVFLDGHGTTESRFFPFVVAFFPVSAALVLASLRRPLVAPLVIAGCALGAAGLGVRAGRTRRDVEALAIAAPIYAVGHGLGMWRGLAELARARRRR